MNLLIYTLSSPRSSPFPQYLLLSAPPFVASANSHLHYTIHSCLVVLNYTLQSQEVLTHITSYNLLSCPIDSSLFLSLSSRLVMPSPSVKSQSRDLKSLRRISKALEHLAEPPLLVIPTCTFSSLFLLFLFISLVLLIPIPFLLLLTSLLLTCFSRNLSPASPAKLSLASLFPHLYSSIFHVFLSLVFRFPLSIDSHTFPLLFSVSVLLLPSSQVSSSS